MAFWDLYLLLEDGTYDVFNALSKSKEIDICLLPYKSKEIEIVRCQELLCWRGLIIIEGCSMLSTVWARCLCISCVCQSSWSVLHAFSYLTPSTVATTESHAVIMAPWMTAFSCPRFYPSTKISWLSASSCATTVAESKLQLATFTVISECSY